MTEPIKLPPLGRAAGIWAPAYGESEVRDYARRAIEQATADLRAELASVLADWNDIVKAIGSPTNGGAIGHAKALRRERDEALAELARLTTLRCVEPFVVRHYAGESHPSIKGNGFDGLTVGNDREEAEQFITWINQRMVPDVKEADK